MSTAASVPTKEPERREPPFSPALVEELLRQLDKAVRAHQLYLHNNPTYLKSVENLRAAFAPVWAQTDSLSLSVTDLNFVWFGVPVHEQNERASDSLPWTFYKDGLREVTLVPGFEGAELELRSHRAPPALFEPDEPALQLAAQALGRACGREPAFVRTGGSIPIVAELAARGYPVIVSGFGLPQDAVHAADESFALRSLEWGEASARELYAALAALPARR